MADNNHNENNTRKQEIQCSISEGRMMLGILNAIPPSETRDSFIRRFEELISALETCKTVDATPHVLQSDIESQIRALKESSDICLPNTSGQAASTSQDADTQSSYAKPQGNGGDAQLPPLLSGEPLSGDSTHALIEIYNDEVAKLDPLIKDTQLIQDMIKRLLLLMEDSNVTESGESLNAISEKLANLELSFVGLKGTHETIDEPPTLPERIRIGQMSGFRNFLSSLDRNLNSTKECFFEIYSQVKPRILESNVLQSPDQISSTSSIATGQTVTPAPSTNGASTVVADATSAVLITEDGNDSAPCLELPSHHSTPTVSTAGAIVLPDNVSLSEGFDSAAAAVDAQRVYLDALRARTASERGEVARLLAQRDRLQERLASLRTVTDDSLSQPSSDATHMFPIGNGSSIDMHDDVIVDPEEVAAVDNLTAKRNELAALRAQLTSLQAKQNQLNSVASSLRSLEQVECDGSVDAPTSLGDPTFNGSPYHDNASRSATAAATMSALSQDTPSIASAAGLTNNTSASACQDTKRLYANMLEARIRFQETANHQRGCRGASIAASQDQTTQATWGGSPPLVAPSTASNSDRVGSSSGMGDDVEEEEGDVSVERLGLGSRCPRIGPTAASGLPSSAPRLSNSNLLRPQTSQPLEASGGAASAMVGLLNHLSSTLAATSITAASSSMRPLDQLSTLPQVGRSPSPSTIGTTPSSSSIRQRTPAGQPPTRPSSSRHRKPRQQSFDQDQRAATWCDQQQNSRALVTDGDLANTNGDVSARLQRLETNSVHLHYLCQSLLADNSHLNTALSQLLFQLGHESSDGVRRPVSDEWLQQLSMSMSNRLVQYNQALNLAYPPPDYLHRQFLPTPNLFPPRPPPPVFGWPGLYSAAGLLPGSNFYQPPPQQAYLNGGLASQSYGAPPISNIHSGGLLSPPNSIPPPHRNNPNNAPTHDQPWMTQGWPGPLNLN